LIKWGEMNWIADLGLRIWDCGLGDCGLGDWQPIHNLTIHNPQSMACPLNQ